MTFPWLRAGIAISVACALSLATTFLLSMTVSEDASAGLGFLIGTVLGSSAVIWALATDPNR